MTDLFINTWHMCVLPKSEPLYEAESWIWLQIKVGIKFK